MKNKRPVIIAVILLLTVINYNRLASNETIRTIQFLYIFSIGMLSGLLINEFVRLFGAKRG